MGDKDEMLKDDVIVCRCEGVTAGEARAAIRLGAHTIKELKQRTRVCMGPCQGQNCTDMLRGMIAELTGRPLADIRPGTFRPPIRPIKLSILAEANED